MKLFKLSFLIIILICQHNIYASNLKVNLHLDEPTSSLLGGSARFTIKGGSDGNTSLFDEEITLEGEGFLEYNFSCPRIEEISASNTLCSLFNSSGMLIAEGRYGVHNSGLTTVLGIRICLKDGYIPQIGVIPNPDSEKNEYGNYTSDADDQGIYHSVTLPWVSPLDQKGFWKKEAFHEKDSLSVLTTKLESISIKEEKIEKELPEGTVKLLAKKFGVYPPKEDIKYRYGEFVLTPLGPEYGCEKDRSDNVSNKKVLCKVDMEEGYLKKSGTIFTTKTPPKAFNDSGTFLWVLDKKGRLYVTTMYGEISQAAIGNQHSFFLKGKLGDEYFGFGRPIACGGHIVVDENGNIIELDNSSGHYKPNKDQFLLAAYYLVKNGVCSKKAIFKTYNGLEMKQDIYTYDQIVELDIMKILNKYKTLNYILS